MSESQGAAPLSGFRVLDFTQVVAGPFCAAMLADMGAEVVKIERPGLGDDTRRITRYKDREEHEDYFYANNRSKKSVAINMKTDAGRAAVRALAGEADALIENMAPGKLAELGLGFEDARALNPRIVYCSLSGFGQSGPYRDRVGLDPILQAVSGVMSVTGTEDPTQIGAPLADVLAGMFSAYAIVSALHAVKREGEGRHIDVSMQDAMVAALGPRMGETLQAGVSPGRHGNENPMRVPANTYRTSDGEYVTVIVQHDGFWPGFCRALELEDWLEDERFSTARARVANRNAINERASKIFASRTMAEWERRLEAERVGFAVVNDYARALADPQVAHRGLIRRVEHPVSGGIRVVGAPWIMSGAQADVKPPPLLGQHTADVLREWLEWPEEEIARFMAGEGVR